MRLSGEESGSKVIVLANSHLKESVELASFYAKVRNIPEKNIISLPMPLQEEIKWNEFSSQILNPLRKALLNRGYLEGRLEEEKDAFGRQQYSPLFNSAKYLVLCRGTPLKLTNEISKVPETKVVKHQKIYRTTVASVDGELALIPSINTPPISYTRNPIFNLQRTDSLAQENLLLVSRLDGPSHKACIGLIQSALAGEKAALGRAYIDSGGPHKQGNDWMERISSSFQKQGISYSYENTKRLFHSGDRFDAPILYFGWHSWHATGPFARMDFRAPPGAMLFHLHSFSAQTLRSDRQNWVGPIVASGAAATIGNVSEPYLHLTHHLDKLSEGLLNGKSLGEAAYYSLPVLSWQAVLIGDPLYRPNLNPVFKGKESRTGFQPFHLQQYGAIQQYRILNNTGKKQDAIQLVGNYLSNDYGLPLALEVAKTYQGKDQKQVLGKLFIPIKEYKPVHFQECAPLLEAAKLLHANDLPLLKEKILQNLQQSKVLPTEINWKDLKF